MNTVHLKRTALLYLSLPVFLFFLGWLQPLAASLACALLGFSTWKAWQYFGNRSLADSFQLSGQQCLLIAVLSLIWVVWSGVGGYSFQNSDFHYRNAVLHDLINQPWPIVYKSTPPTYLLYYFTSWLPAACVGKLSNWETANTFYFLWVSGGLFLTLSLFTANIGYFNSGHLLLFIFFSGLDYVGFVYTQGAFPRFGYHIEWWNKTCQFASTTSDLFWVFNQTVPAWLVTVLILHRPALRTVAFLSCLIIPFAPLPSVGLAVLTSFLILHSFITRRHEGFLRLARELLCPDNLLGSLAILPVFYLFFHQTKGVAVASDTLLHGATLAADLKLYLVFLFLEVGILLLVYYRQLQWDALLAVALVSLALIPLYKAGGNNEFCMRVSMPALIVLALYLAKANSPVYWKSKGDYALKTAQVLVLLLASLTPLCEFYRTYHAVSNFGIIRADDMKTLNPGNDVANASANYIQTLDQVENKHPWLFKFSQPK